MRNFGKIGLPSKKGNRVRGIGLLEMLIAIAAGALVLTVMAKLTLFTARSFVALGNYNDLDKASVLAVDAMTRELRQATQISGFSSNRIDFVCNDGVTATYWWQQTPRTLSRIKGGQTKVLLTQCDFLQFKVYSRVPTNNSTFMFTPTTVTNSMKLVDVNWRCSRQILQQKVNTESVQTASIVLRN